MQSSQHNPDLYRMSEQWDVNSVVKSQEQSFQTNVNISRSKTKTHTIDYDKLVCVLCGKASNRDSHFIGIMTEAMPATIKRSNTLDIYRRYLSTI